MGKRKKTWTPAFILGKVGGWGITDMHLDECALIVAWKVRSPPDRPPTTPPANFSSAVTDRDGAGAGQHGPRSHHLREHC